uniref:Transposase IS200-like domain-containing protein n=1 Tax=uncultured bacterium 16 TaxID=1748268 RepID=A0A0U3TTF9_9BACT|nr:hypothetical protein [uncultured bacterium 16]
MVLYRRSRIANAPHFLTAVLHDRGTRLLLDYVDELRAAFRCAAVENPFHIDAVVVLPDHFHLLCTLPEGDADFSVRMKTIKRRFTFGVAHCGRPMKKNDRGEASCWQSRFWEHTIRDDEDFARHVDYIHYNPVKHGLSARVCDWPHSSFHRYVRYGLLEEDWGGVVPTSPVTPTGE